MNDLDKIRAISLKLTEGLSKIDLGEILLTYHVITQSAKILLANNDREAISILDGLQQNIFDEIAARIYRGDIDIKDAAEFHNNMMEKYYQLKDSNAFKEIQKGLLGLGHSEADFKRDLNHMAEDFTMEYNEIFGVKRLPAGPKAKVPTPDEIINGKQIKGLPNN